MNPCRLVIMLASFVAVTLGVGSGVETTPTRKALQALPEEPAQINRGDISLRQQHANATVLHSRGKVLLVRLNHGLWKIRVLAYVVQHLRVQGQRGILEMH